ncbi:Signal transduction histidine kinase [Ignavibacterium album JCM 16511]|uniref:histidine kinase n=1 Tax=Ignavibacterium album (strain DSM 19864 / JCM 16511 / NBRC 101810 / Mat9-16) TaxID=945713 RepID=I0AFV8_IGNAJ|nr:ATP-binding protein [Ignavibacterium album]AFH47865.1 Signal transduction histidine kinase [Ignavibacterium album JCM 16511]
MLMNLEKYFKSTRFKTTLWYSLIFLLLEIVLGTIIYVYVNQTMRNELDLSLTKQAESIYRFVKESQVNLFEFEPDSVYSTPDELVYDIIFEALAFNPNNTFVQVSIKDKTVFRTANLGKVVFKTSNQENVLRLVDYKEPDLSEYPIRAAYLNKGDYKIIVAFPLELISKTLDNLADLYVIIAPLFLILSFVVGSFLSFKALARIDKIIKRTDEIDTFNLDTFLDGEEYDDEYGRLVKTINKMLRRIKSSIEYMNQFTISASHELKTPLTILRGELELAIKSPKSKEQYLEIIQSSYEETLRLINIVERLFFITKLDNSLIKLNKTKINLVNLVSEVVDDFKNIAEEKKITLTQQYPENTDLIIDADSEMMRQVFINLIDNAIKYSLEQSDILIVIKDEEKISFSITNKSEPIPKEIIPKLFDRFYRMETSRNRNLGGVGLGLSVVKHIIDLHKFEIKILSDEQGLFKAEIKF